MLSTNYRSHHHHSTTGALAGEPLVASINEKKIPEMATRVPQGSTPVERDRETQQMNDMEEGRVKLAPIAIGGVPFFRPRQCIFTVKMSRLDLGIDGGSISTSSRTHRLYEHSSVVKARI